MKLLERELSKAYLLEELSKILICPKVVAEDLGKPRRVNVSKWNDQLE